ncbi:cell envelope biogenesis protein TolA [Providencia sp. CRE-3FA-0001]|uniref:Cell envelope biogenesis protein TolA n=1 Tax=Providencia huashanensis TaxID=3037798 RepID=A0AA42FGU8_9GAMM|nr:cell envelope biogenesis protein TolA [Providencia sp. CRE-3FA-0001]EHZ7762378.1 cell envelope biogenesis protein TolA [Providencia rettgeri]EIJ7165520.1 cell envelope biogenesis protein TolA [Providencia rettgeri]ELR5174824.1 cell envelope biogenesis protein TolA [Providencia rettgeri]ELR5197668.1 cell envelope biogenesis protein TolA [Providencia rettgeri]MDG4696373.1 cell envelope biogenesis protein TolA [Providencia sp. CRE-3FA-0001]
MANELVVIEKSTALEVFKSSDSVEDIIRKVEQEVNSFIPDVSTVKGRKEIASLAYKVAQSKTYLDGLGKDLVAELKEIPKLIDANRRTVRERFDTLRDKVRQPLTEWEAEQERIEAEKQMLAWHEEALEMNAAFDKALAERIESDHEIALLMNEKFDRDLAEAKAEAERQRIAREEELKKQAAEQARLEAEQKAQQEIEAAAQREREAKEAQERAEREKQEAIQRAEQEAKEAKEKAERDAKEAQERAEREKQAAIEAERKKALKAEQSRLAEEERKRQEDAKRQEDKEHRRVINREVLQALVSNGFDEKLATEFIKLVASNQIPHMTMNY